MNIMADGYATRVVLLSAVVGAERRSLVKALKEKGLSA
jgi:hypothetical protein